MRTMLLILLCSISVQAQELVQRRLPLVPVAASSSWTWATLGADLIQWNTAEAVSGNHQDLITTWTASDGDNLSNTGGSARPKLMTNGISGRAVKTLYFDGTDDWFDGASSMSNAQPFTIAVTFLYTNVTVATGYVYDGLHDNDGRAILRNNTVPQFLFYSGTFQPISGDNNLHTALVVHDGANSRIATDGGAWVGLGNIGSQPMQGVTLGIAQDRSTGPFGGHIREFVVTAGTNWLTTHYSNATNYQHSDVR